MNEKRENRAILEDYPQISQKLRLTCRKCGKSEVYDVGAILCNPDRERGSGYLNYFFANYFHCLHCGSGGPWDVANFLRLLYLLTRARVSRKFEGIRSDQGALFDGTFIQTPAMGEQLLLERIQKDPGNAFLCSRLGNLLRNCAQKSKAAVWHAKALELDPDDIEARHSLSSPRENGACAQCRATTPSSCARRSETTRDGPFLRLTQLPLQG